MATTPVAIAEPSFEALRAMMDGSPVELAAPAAPEPTKVEEPAAEPESVETKQEPSVAEPAEEPLPKGVEKRIAKEVARQAELDRKIAEHVATTKAKEAELAKLAGTPGPEPVKNTAPANELSPEPVYGEKASETWDQFEARRSSWRAEERTFILAEAKRIARAELDADAQAKAAADNWSAAVKKHGDGFDAKVHSLVSKITPEIGLAIRKMENWSDIAVHLEDHPEELAAIKDQFASNEYRGVAALGRLEAKLTAPKTAAPKVQELPDPPRPIGGKTSASAGTVDLEKISMSRFKSEVGRMIGKK